MDFTGTGADVQGNRLQRLGCFFRNFWSSKPRGRQVNQGDKQLPDESLTHYTAAYGERVQTLASGLYAEQNIQTYP
jgi:hypothetical protein